MNGRATTPPRLSVVVPTLRRPALLRRCLQALLAQRIDAHAFEVIVVDDGREEAVRALVGELDAQQRHTPPLRYLRPSSGRGPAAARNLGWRAARAPVIAFTDDDTLPDADWLTAGERALLRNPRWAGLCGRVEVPRPEGASARPSDHELMTRGLASAEFVTANAFVRRAALERVGGFDERFTRAWREDSDLQFRLLRDAGPVGRSDEARVVHPVRPERWGVSLRQQRNTYFDALLYKKHPRLYRQRIRPRPPWNYYAIVALAGAAPVLGWRGAATAATAACAGAACLALHLAWLRLRRTDRSWRHVAEMVATSTLIPFLSVYWRVRGAIRFRTPFL